MDAYQRCQRIPIRMTVAADGTGTFYTDQPVNGRMLQLRYVKNNFADGSTMTLTTEATGQPVLAESAINASATRCPRQATHDTAGAASLYDTTDNEPVEDYIWASNERIKCEVADAGDKKSGVWWVYVG